MSIPWKLQKEVLPTSEWLDGFKTMSLDDMLVDLTLLGEENFVRAVCEKIYGPMPEDEK